ncbi:TPA: hypothetical protein ACQ0F8_002084 [Streptococcus agalactiae]|nr:hypothetical protein [Streptococcus agalactiae]HEO4177390.1 hypothetical protein [Streptococcus agalactiae]
MANPNKDLQKLLKQRKVNKSTSNEAAETVNSTSSNTTEQLNQPSPLEVLENINKKEPKKSVSIAMRPSYRAELEKLAKQFNVGTGVIVEVLVADACGFDWQPEGNARS